MSRKKSTEQFKKEVYDLVGNEYTVLGEYIDCHSKITMIHCKCGNKYEVSPNNFLRGQRCPKCFSNIKKTTEQFKKEVYDLVGDEYTVLGEYISCRKYIMMRHNKCNYKFNVTPNHFLLGTRCPKCAGNIRSNTDIYKQKVYDLVGNEYSVLDEYINNSTKILVRHNKCGYEYYVTPGNFLLRNRRCPKCAKISKAEKRISEYLKSSNINYKEQVSFPDCRYKLPLKFDFQIFLENNDNIILIEYDGIQHYDSSKQFAYGNKQKYNNLKLRDKIKDDYCIKKGIHLYRISYKEFNDIEKVLNEIIKKERI